MCMHACVVMMEGIELPITQDLNKHNNYKASMFCVKRPLHMQSCVVTVIPENSIIFCAQWSDTQDMVCEVHSLCIIKILLWSIEDLIN